MRRLAVRSLALSLAALGAGLLAFAPAASAARPPRPQEAARAALDKAAAAYARLKTARGTFEQVLTNPLTRNTARSRGEYALHRATGRWALAFSDPKGDRVVDDGKALWVYLPSTNPGQVIKLRSAASGTGMDLIHRFFGDPAARYEIADKGLATVGGKSVRAVGLTPMSPMEFARATVWVDPADGTLRQFEVTELSGLVRRFTFLTVAIDGKVNEKALTFTPPRGVKVFDQARAGR